MAEQQAVSIVLVEDDLGHATLIERHLRRARVTNDIRHFSDGQTAVDYFFGEGLRRPLPLLVLLDLHLPGLHGMQVLQRLKADRRTRHIPVICLTTTDYPPDIEQCYSLGCNLYITKPIAYDPFAAAIQQIGVMLTIAKIPQGGTTP